MFALSVPLLSLLSPISAAKALQNLACHKQLAHVMTAVYVSCMLHGNDEAASPNSKCRNDKSGQLFAWAMEPNAATKCSSAHLQQLQQVGEGFELEASS